MNIKIWILVIGMVLCPNSLAQKREPVNLVPLAPSDLEKQKIERNVRVAQPQILPNGITLTKDLPTGFLWPVDSAFQEGAKGEWNSVEKMDDVFHQWAAKYIPDVPGDAIIYAEAYERYCSMNIAERSWSIRFTYAYRNSMLKKPSKVELLNIKEIPEAQVDELLRTTSFHGITQKHPLKDIPIADSMLKNLPIHEKIKSRAWTLERCTFDRQGKFVELFFDAPSTEHGKLKLKLSVGVKGQLVEISGLALEDGLDAQDRPTTLPILLGPP